MCESMRRVCMCGYVCGWFEARGIDLQLDVSAVEQLPGIAHQTDTEKRRQWFRSQVRKSARLNASTVGLEDTLKDLGLWDQLCLEYKITRK